MEIHLQNRQRSVRINPVKLKNTVQTLLDTKYFRNIFKKALPLCCSNRLELSIVFVSEKTIRQMNKKFRGIDKVTDVLSFPMFDYLDRGKLLHNNLLGDVVVCPLRAMAQAKEYNVDIDEEMIRLIIHGILHLLGYDHERGKKEAQRMSRVQNMLCDLLNSAKKLKPDSFKFVG